MTETASTRKVTLGDRHMGVNNVPKVVTRQRGGRGWNSRLCVVTEFVEQVCLVSGVN